MKIILEPENNLSPQQVQSFSAIQRSLLDQFLLNPDQYTHNSIRTSSVEHQDGVTERWQVTLAEDFKLFLDCGISLPWSSSQKQDYYSVVIIVGYDAGPNNFYLP